MNIRVKSRRLLAPSSASTISKRSSATCKTISKSASKSPMSTWRHSLLRWPRCLTNSRSFKCKLSRSLRTKSSRLWEISKRIAKMTWRLSYPNSTSALQASTISSSKLQLLLSKEELKNLLRPWDITILFSMSLTLSTKSTSTITRRWASFKDFLIRTLMRSLATLMT